MWEFLNITLRQKSCSAIYLLDNPFLISIHLQFSASQWRCQIMETCTFVLIQLPFLRFTTWWATIVAVIPLPVPKDCFTRWSASGIFFCSNKEFNRWTGYQSIYPGLQYTLYYFSQSSFPPAGFILYASCTLVRWITIPISSEIVLSSDNWFSFNCCVCLLTRLISPTFCPCVVIGIVAWNLRSLVPDLIFLRRLQVISLMFLALEISLDKYFSIQKHQPESRSGDCSAQAANYKKPPGTLDLTSPCPAKSILFQV